MLGKYKTLGTKSNLEFQCLLKLWVPTNCNLQSNFKGPWGHVTYLTIYLSIFLSNYLSNYLSIYLSIYPTIYLSERAGGQTPTVMVQGERGHAR